MTVGINITIDPTLYALTESDVQVAYPIAATTTAYCNGSARDRLWMANQGGYFEEVTATTCLFKFASGDPGNREWRGVFQYVLN